ncbi:PREDICTED: pleiotrophin-like [Branchiostoma belcheri]|uniref:Pleiotrophin-like n=1 Tax=Branchiostoma belcheri TaxID=7741 RepID=A0A6P5A4G6_BRABE|nr:PREDICTED: pleiotrophin-like [Branchiostoma belcheri]
MLRFVAVLSNQDTSCKRKPTDIFARKRRFFLQIFSFIREIILNYRRSTMKTVLLVTVLCVLVSCLQAEEDTAARRRRGKKEPKEGCSGWTWQSCVPANGDCGWGQRQGTQEGPNCKILSKTIKCRIPCGRRKEYGDCRYQKESWECDADTNMETRTLQLKRAVKGATCDPEVTETRPCKGGGWMYL